MNKALHYATTVALLWVSAAIFSAASAEEIARFLKIPIFIVTDRNLATSADSKAGVTFGPQRKYVGVCLHDPFMGISYCVVENVQHKALSKRLSDLGWQACDKAKLGTVETTLITGATFIDIQKVFYSKLYDSAMLTNDHEIFGFVHGFNNSFHSGIQPAARIAYFSERPVLFYSWPSAGKLGDYSTDENNAEWSQEHFNDVVSHLTKLGKRDQPLSVRMFAHSMGTRLVVRATPYLRENTTFKEFGLVCPDIDQGLVMHYSKKYLSEKGTATVRLYMSRRDKALVLSQLLHGGYNRLGECADSLGNLATQSINTLANLVPGASAAAAKTQPKQAEEETDFQARLKITKDRFQTIDFTVLDGGMIGHRIPAELICNMAHTGKPGYGLRLVDENSGKRNKFARFLAGAKHLKSQENRIGGTVFLVAKNANEHHNIEHAQQDNAQQDRAQKPLLESAQ